MITLSSSPVQRERDTQSLRRRLTAHHGDFRALPRANRPLQTDRNPFPGAFQQIAFVDTETGECGERRLMHHEEAEQFYGTLKERSVRPG